MSGPIDSFASTPLVGRVLQLLGDLDCFLDLFEQVDFRRVRADVPKEQLGGFLAELRPDAGRGAASKIVGGEPLDARPFACAFDSVIERSRVVAISGRDHGMGLAVGAGSISLAQGCLSSRESLLVDRAHGDGRLEDVVLRLEVIDPSLQDHLGSQGKWDGPDPLTVSRFVVPYQADVEARHV